jgi:glycosyltransferase involved in cell wall biosynthesis
MKDLAVSIPTFKRPELLQRCLEALAKQCITRGVEIYVFDDSCSDINRKVYEKLVPIYSNIQVNINAINLGIDKNIDQCITVPQSSYVWVIGEDDLVENGAIDLILERIESNHPEYMFVNYQYISNDYKRRLDVAIPEMVDQTYVAGVFFEKNGWATGFLGANIVNKKNWDSRCVDYLGTYFNHVGKIFSALDPSDEITAITKPIIFNRAESLNSFSWLHECFEVMEGFGFMTDSLGSSKPIWANYAKGCLVNYNNKINFMSYKSLLVLRAHGVYNFQKYQKYIARVNKSKLYLLISILPINILYKAYNIFKNFKKIYHE